jgi:hypothetical protein
MDEEEADKKALELYEKISDWVEGEPDRKPRVTVLKSPARVEVIKSAVGALDITVVALDQFSVRAPLSEPKNMGENEMLETVKRWLGPPI